MCELLVKATSNFHSNPIKDQRGCWKVGMIVECRDDNCGYGTLEGLPTFFHVKIPMVPKENPVIQKLMDQQQIAAGFEDDGTTPRVETVRRRKRWIRHADIPQAIKDKLLTTGEIIIKAHPSYDGPYDVTWSAIKAYIWDDDLQANITDDIT